MNCFNNYSRYQSVIYYSSWIFINYNTYLNKLEFKLIGEYDEYLIVGKDKIEIHFFSFKDLNKNENYGQVYIRTTEIQKYYQTLLDNKIWIHPNGQLEAKPWGQKEFALLDPDHNLLTFGQSI